MTVVPGLDVHQVGIEARTPHPKASVVDGPGVMGASGQGATDRHAVVLVGEFGVYDALSDVAHSAYQDGDTPGAILMCRALETLAVAVGDAQTLRYALYIRGLAANELGRGDEASDCAEQLLVLARDDLRTYWQAKALALKANAHSGRGDSAGALDLLARASVMLGVLDGRDYNQVSASGAIALALRRVDLFEASDKQLRQMIGLLRPWDAITMVADSLHTVAEWGLALQVIGDTAAAAQQFVVCASRAAWLRRLVTQTGRCAFDTFAVTGEVFAATMLGETQIALDVIPQLLTRDELRTERVERLLAHFALATALVEVGRFDEAQDHLLKLREIAVDERRTTWMTIADAALMRMYVRQFGDHPAVSRSFAMYQRLAVSQWSEREARFDNLQSRVRVHRLIEEGAQITELSRQDALTGASNRRVLADVLDGPLVPVSAVFVDVDNFKWVNDSFSHVVGDQVLVRLVELLRTASRSEDRIVRYGGDEFLVLLDPVTTGSVVAAERVALGLANRILHVVRSHDWAVLCAGLAITVSVGVVSSVDPADLLTSVSAALHEAKESGRDRLVVGDPRL
ncbi:GGDEF domain-containing protein [Pengzhenrongella frigida]|uniref:GGDEF domain-containing protein n=1 Tax=Pengzhenrongella frigida TaxID=1259133 RepID=A0A4Q5N542_9MICO|nr:GGDEF domain-containing protein [Cellulomonas sp. HLT2-17]RYV52573.1 GGDEF domain-containing protein [Cellulomonas sp. HLT2-17]